jgi:ubiquinone/menaquinone biosynthesis C-methylase UbiE
VTDAAIGLLTTGKLLEKYLKNNLISVEMDSYLRQLVETNAMREPVINAVIRSLTLPPGSRGLDAGCGIGQQSVLLADAIGKDGHVFGVDISRDFIDYAIRFARNAGFSDRTSFICGDVTKLPFERNYFDWALSIDCVGYNPSDPMPALGEMARAVKPGGTIAIVAYSAQQLLPGYPLLEARLNATSAGIAPFNASMSPDRHFFRALGWMRKLEFKCPEAATFAESFHAPISVGIKEGLAALLKMRWESARSALSEKDWAQYQRLCEPDSPDFILDSPDYYGFFTYSIFKARR